MKKYLYLSLLFLSCTLWGAVKAQTPISGVITNQTTAEGIAGAHIYYKANTMAFAISDTAGYFVLPQNVRPDSITVSHVAYRNKKVAIGQDSLHIALESSACAISEIIVSDKPLTAEDIVKRALRKVNRNYGKKSVLYKGFLREKEFVNGDYPYAERETIISLYQKKRKSKWSFAIHNFRGKLYGSPKSIDPSYINLFYNQKHNIRNYDLRKIIFTKKDLKKYNFKIHKIYEQNNDLLYEITYREKKSTHKKPHYLLINSSDWAFLRYEYDNNSFFYRKKEPQQYVLDKFFIETYSEEQEEIERRIVSFIALEAHLNASKSNNDFPTAFTRFAYYSGWAIFDSSMMQNNQGKRPNKPTDFDDEIWSDFKTWHQFLKIQGR
ncbi:MAG: carboxypeptidase-like regulatory domain-containing protein [Bernardetiaceae bacterium]|nr:carboxypeptidase-like regulatory domain-containing protein [Bernardetiaceae bacterium]